MVSLMTAVFGITIWYLLLAWLNHHAKGVAPMWMGASLIVGASQFYTSPENTVFIIIPFIFIVILAVYNTLMTHYKISNDNYLHGKYKTVAMYIHLMFAFHLVGVIRYIIHIAP